MTSQSKKNKARNSYLYNGGEKDTIKLKRIKYYNKRQRKEIKAEINGNVEEVRDMLVNHINYVRGSDWYK